MNYWQCGIANLISSGISVREISNDCGLAVSSVYDLKNGHSTEPRGISAVRLHAMIEKLSTATYSTKDAVNA